MLTCGVKAFWRAVDRQNAEGTTLTPDQKARLLVLQKGADGEARESMRDAQRYSFFWDPADTEKGTLSPYYPAAIQDPEVAGGASFGSVEQYVQYVRAIFMCDAAAALAVLSESDPQLCGAVGARWKPCRR